MLTVDDLVRREVVHSVSALVHTLAQCVHYTGDDLEQLCTDAYCLSTPTYDPEEALIQEGYSRADDGWQHPEYGWFSESASDLCEIQNIEPHQREVYEHWIVTDWLADKLEAKGEKVDRDFAGLTIWARTCTGQSIALDAVMVEIHAELMK